MGETSPPELLHSSLFDDCCSRLQVRGFPSCAGSKKRDAAAEILVCFETCSGGAGAAARELHTAPSRMTSRSPFSTAADSDGTMRPAPQQQLSSPFSAFSAGNTPATSPFSQAAREAQPPAEEDQRLGLSEKGSRGRTWHQVGSP